LPAIIVPYKRHSAETIERLVEGDTEGLVYENSFLYRIKAWWAALALYFRSVLTSLQFKYGVVYGEKAALREIVRAVVNANLWVTTRSVCMSG
jgi:uncharacterized membrane protein